MKIFPTPPDSLSENRASFQTSRLFISSRSVAAMSHLDLWDVMASMPAGQQEEAQICDDGGQERANEEAEGGNAVLEEAR